jgi:cell division protein FtsW
MARGEIHRSFLRSWWRSIDQQTIISLGLLFAFSLMLVTTASPAVAHRIGLEATYFSSRHTIYLLLGGISIFCISLIDIINIRRLGIIGLAASIILLILVKFYGYEVKGATRWINIAGFSMQPSEFVKPFFIIATAWILSMKSKEYPAFAISLVLYLTIITLLFLQPDFGMVVMVSLIWGVQLFVSGLPIIWIIIAMIGGAGLLLFAYNFLPHATDRINNFLNPKVGENYQVTKSLKAFEQGGLYGKGPGEGSVKQVLPDSHADFIFSVAGEEFGAIICLIIATIFAFIVVRGLLLLIDEEDRFTILAATGILCQFGLQAIINMGVTLNMLPTKGMTLPFISYGGSSTMAIAIGMGFLLSLTRKRGGLTKYRMQMLEL